MANIKKTSPQPKAKTKKKAAPDEFERARARLDKKIRDRDMATHWGHFWNVCPKCGGDMFEQQSMETRFDVCRKCHGVYIDQAEVALALKHLDPVKWLKALLRKAKKPTIKRG